MSIQSDLLAEIEAFLAANQMSETAFGKRTVHDGKFVARLRGGANMTLGTLDRARRFLDQNKNIRPVTPNDFMQPPEVQP